MNSIDQKLVDFLYENIFTQKIRCDHFNTLVPQLANSIWNKHTDEQKILDRMVQKYKKYYHDKAEEIREKLIEQKESNVTSYLTYDADYYINQYIERDEEITKYLVDLDSKTFDYIVNNKLSCISDTISKLFPYHIVDPLLLGKI